ncbi:MAG: gliding motility-associated C-terminal domain-containing protein [Cyclobacteriaceae bacterium]|nr:gliding motility-associated C-terminal domain-containing protein [Cyclobacteriaceae bacterium]
MALNNLSRRKELTLFSLVFLFLSVTVLFAQTNGRNGDKNKITICHYPPGNPENVQTITIDKSAWAAHQDHGDSKGDCDKKKNKDHKISICHYPPGNPENVQTITIDESAWEAHAAHGDSRGTCTIINNSGGENQNPPNETDPDSEDDHTVNNEQNDPNDEEDKKGEIVIIKVETEPSEETTSPEEKSRECLDNFSSTLTKLSFSNSESGICSQYQLVVSYNGEFSYDLSHVAIGLPCGTVSNVTNSMDWAQVVNSTDPTTGLNGFKIDNISNFCKGDEPNNFTINFTLCTEEITCYENCSFEIGYKAGQCISYQTVSANCSKDDFPTATITNSGQIEVCAGDPANIAVALTGVGPWQVVYTDGSKNHTVTVESSDWTITTETVGTYSLVDVVDNNGVSGFTKGSTTIVVLEKPSVKVSGPERICVGESADIVFELNGSGPWVVDYTDGVQTYSIETNESRFVITTTIGGEFTATGVQDAKCSNTDINSEDAVAKVVIAELPTAVISGGELEAICQGESTKLLFNMDGVGPWNVTYGNGSTTKSFTSTEKYWEENVSDEGSYYIIDVNNGNCTNQGIGEVQVVKMDPIMGQIAVNPEYCEAEEVLLQFESSNSAKFEVDWVVEGGTGTFKNKQGSLVYYVPSSTDEELTFTAKLTNKCESKTSSASTKIVRINPAFLAEPSKFEDYKTRLEYEFVPESQDGDSYEWTFDNVYKDYSPTAYYTFEEPGEHTISLSVTKGDCESSLEKTISIKANRNIFIPSVFNPEASNETDRAVRVFGEDISNEGFAFEIYNRWGKAVYKTTSFEEANSRGWNGSIRNKTQELGVYTYVLRGKFNDGDIINLQGTVTLVK